MIKAVIFDMDGIIFNTEIYGFKAAEKLFLEYGKKINQNDVKPFFGRGIRNYIHGVAIKYNVKENIDYLVKKRNKYFYDLSAKKIEVFPGIINLLKKLKNREIKTAIATGSSYNSVIKNIELSKINMNLFDEIISSNNTKKFKPNPEVFLKAIKKLNVKKSECVIIEDSVSGIIAAKRAKIKVIAITNSLPAKKLYLADMVVDSAKDITLKKMNNL